MAGPRPSALALALALIVPLALAGCLGEDAAPAPAPAPAAGMQRVEGREFTADLQVVRGGISNVSLTSRDGGDLTVTVLAPERVTLLGEAGFVAAREATVKSGATLRLLAPPSLSAQDLEVNAGGSAETLTLTFPDASPMAPLLSGREVMDLVRLAGTEYPYRAAGTPSYAAFLDWAAGYFEGLGMRVVVDPYGTRGAPDPAPLPLFGGRPTSAANVCGFLDGAVTPDEWIVYGGHFDIVEGIPEGAYDDTTGTMIAFHLAKAFAGTKPTRTLVFCGWGGEEDGLVGSMVFAKTLPPTVRVVQYHNFDMAGLNWPLVPDAESPNPLTVSGNDAYKDAMVPYAEAWLRGVLEYPEEGVRTGAYVTGGSDHMSFATSGIPAFTYSAMGGGSYPHYHQPEDTLANLTAVAIGKLTTDEFEPGDAERGEEALARGIETVLWSAFYLGLGAEFGQFSATPSPVR